MSCVDHSDTTMYSKCQPLQLTLTALSGKLSLTSNLTSFFTSATLGPSIVADVGAAQHQRGHTGQRPHLKTLPFALTSHHHTSHITPHYHPSPFTSHYRTSLVTLTFHPLLLTDILHPSLHSSPLTLPHSLTHHLSLSLIPSLITSHSPSFPHPSPLTSHSYPLTLHSPTSFTQSTHLPQS